MTALCSSCGKRPVHTRGLCSPCYRRARRAKKTMAQQYECRIVKLLYCPRDPELGVPMYPCPRHFPRMQFMETLAEGYWPDGCEVEYALDYRGNKTRWRTDGQFIFEIGTDRVAMGEFGPGEHVRVRLVEPMAAKGETR